MRVLYLHIGFHKTGTTAIQNYLWKYRNRLKARGICYPAVALSGTTHAKLANVLKGDAFRSALGKMRALPEPHEFDPYGIESDENAKSLYSELSKVIKRNKCHTTVISSECFLEWIEPAAVAQQFLSLGLEVKVVVYLRRQDLWIESVFNQVVKDRFLHYSGEFDALPQQQQMDYKSVLDEWALLFGRDNIVVRVYETSQLHNGDVVDDFLSVIGVGGRIEGKGVTSVRHMDNLSLHRDVLALLHRVNLLKVGETERQLILESFLPINESLIEHDSSGKHGILSAEQRRAILQQYADCNAAVAREYLHRDDGVLFYDAATNS